MLYNIKEEKEKLYKSLQVAGQQNFEHARGIGDISTYC